MRWAIVGSLASDSLEYHLLDSLRASRHEAEVFDLTLPGRYGAVMHYWLRRVSAKYDLASARSLAKKIIGYKPDILFVTYRHIHPSTIDIIKSRIPHLIAIHMNPDHLVNLEQQQILASSYDYWFTKDPYMQSFMHRIAGLNAFYLPEAFNPRFHRSSLTNRIELEKKVNTDILVFGNLYPYRTKFIEQIINKGFSVKLFGIKGPFFPKSLAPLFTNEVITGSNKAEKVYGAKIVLNNFHYAEIEGVNCKYFEINGIGGFQLCDYKSALTEYSPIDPGRYSFESTDQAIELIHYYLNHAEERHEIADFHQQHFLTYHTYENRILSIIDIVQNKRKPADFSKSVSTS